MIEAYDEIPTRKGYGDGLVKLGENNPDVIVLGADLTKSTYTHLFRERFPERFFQIGIAEQDMLGTAAGFALTGKIPYVSTYSVFVTGRAFDQIRTTVCYSNLNVKTGGAHGGISVGPDGATHQALEDIGLMRILPSMKVMVPADYNEAVKATVASAEIEGPVFIRFGRENVPAFTGEDDDFDFGKAKVLREGGDVVIFATGIMVYHALQAAEKLKEKSVEATVVNIHTIKPMDEKTLLETAKITGCAVTCEESQLMGGFGSAVCEVLSRNYPIPVEMVGICDTFGESGQPDQLIEEYGLSPDSIVKAALKAVKRK